MEKQTLYDSLREMFYSIELHKILSLELRNLEEGYCATSVQISESHMNPQGIVHGGIPFLLADTTMGMAIRTKDVIGVTIDMNIHYFEPIEFATNLECRGWVEKLGSKIIIAEAEFIDADTGVKKGVARATFFKKQSK